VSLTKRVEVAYVGRSAAETYHWDAARASHSIKRTDGPQWGGGVIAEGEKRRGSSFLLCPYARFPAKTVEADADWPSPSAGLPRTGLRAMLLGAVADGCL